MANKNRNLIVAYFPDVDSADAAGRQLKHWDKELKEIKLGGMGVVYEKKGKLKTHYIGYRATGTGAKWGTFLGATGGLATGVLALTGVLTGGIGLIPGAIAGLAAGAVGGSLFHKRLKMSDEERARLEEHLHKGGAALAVMADDDEVLPTEAEITNLGGQTSHYVLPEEIVDEIEETAETVEEAVDETTESFAELPVEEQEEVAVMIAASSIDAEAAVALMAVDVNDAETFLQRAATPQGRAELASATGYDASTILLWANELDLARVRGIGPKYAALLKATGVDTVPELAQRNPANLTAALADANASSGIVKAPPYQGQVESWVGQAKELPRILTY